MSAPSASPPHSLVIPRDFDLEELLACARFGELDELKALIAGHPSPPAALLGLASPELHGNSTALHMAAANGHADVVAFLLGHIDRDAVNRRNEGGNTALHWASLNGHISAVELLLKAGADPKALNNAGRDPLHEAESKGLEIIASMLVRSGAAGDEGPADGSMKEEEVEGAEDEAQGDAEGDAAMDA